MIVAMVLLAMFVCCVATIAVDALAETNHLTNELVRLSSRITKLEQREQKALFKPFSAEQIKDINADSH